MFIDNHDLVLMAQKSGEAIASLASLSPTPLINDWMSVLHGLHSCVEAKRET